MTILNVAVGQSSNTTPGAIALATAGIIAGSVVIVILGISTIIAIYCRQTPKQKLMNTVYHDEEVEIRRNPVRAPPLERQRSMTYPTEPEIVVPKPIVNVMKNPFAPKSNTMKFSPTVIRTSYDPPPPPPPMEDV
jgi:hypothetical protein